jgi:FAD:protein FMN transferase
MAARLEQEPFRAMGTMCSVAVTVVDPDVGRARRALSAARAEVAACERALSRFMRESELSRLNASAGEWVAAGPRLRGALEAALRARRETGGLFDPTILPALAAAGYDRSYDQLSERPAQVPAGWRAGARIELDPAGGRARIEHGAAADLGGIGKGYSAVRALEAMRAALPSVTGGLVDLGGDVAVWGATPEGGPWRLAVADPRRRGARLGTVDVEAGGVATSGRDARRFGPGRRMHHLIDPATGAPASAGPLAATVVARDVVEAEAHATALAIMPRMAAAAYVAARPNLGVVLVPDVGEPEVIGHLCYAAEVPRRRVNIRVPVGGM